jgi:hypothetical protein
MGKTIEELADDYCKSTLVGSQYVRKNSYIQGAKDVLQAVMDTIAVSEDEWLRSNLRILTQGLKGDLQFDNGTIEDNLNF